MQYIRLLKSGPWEGGKRARFSRFRFQPCPLIEVVERSGSERRRKFYGRERWLAIVSCQVVRAQGVGERGGGVADADLTFLLTIELR